MKDLINNIVNEFRASIDINQAFLKTSFEESNLIEFKKSLHTKGESIDKDYLKTISGYANNKGGVILFGIDPDSKELVGIKDVYENLDNRYISTTIRDGLDGNFEFTFFTQTYLGKIIGFLVVKEASVKPIIMKVDSSSFKVGDIYFRYPAQTAKILAADLRKIINEEIAKRLQGLLGNIDNLVKLGDSAAILNTSSGEIQTGDKLPKLILDEKILNKLNLIKEGTLSEVEGAPAYIIKGEIELGNVEIVKTVPSIITEHDILEQFFDRHCEAPDVVLEMLVFQNSPYLPFYFFAQSANLSKEEAIDFLNSIDKPDMNKLTRNKLVNRLNKFEYKKQGKILEGITESCDCDIDLNVQVSSVKDTYKEKCSHGQVERTIFFNTLLNKFELKDEYISAYPKNIIEAFSSLLSETLSEDPEY
ncbi:AlbA family DNA-binding domain-containing protein [Rufibacter tibetensis]|uniref:Schlafen AlbA-2 domain-containing protein n=1 Tax=Rufibacter tibetensis TaxID=512763 RepID=A0A0P0C722_9BACT|nr:ATP-binding protein [Rufibacter tibetensis]ALJ00822.1 hypothetical protein DC20_19820 [Rufibacter tibetensis]